VILDWLLAVVVLLVASVILNLAEGLVAGYEEFPLHLGNVVLLTTVGAALFPFWGWRSTAWVLGIWTVWSLAGALWQRRSGTTRIIYHGMSPHGSRQSPPTDVNKREPGHDREGVEKP